jgi:hypothetical protein
MKGIIFLRQNKLCLAKLLYNENNELQFSLHGTIRNGRSDMTLVFIFPFAQIAEYKDLVQLNDVRINLAKNNCTVKIWQNNVETTLTNLSGELYFKRTQLLSIDDKVNRVILSGTFEIRFLENGFPTSISDGRFDVGITKNVFYFYQKL